MTKTQTLKSIRQALTAELPNTSGMRIACAITPAAVAVLGVTAMQVFDETLVTDADTMRIRTAVIARVA